VEILDSRFGTCACGGVLEEQLVAITAPRTGRRRAVQLLEVEEGVCPICKSRVYKTRSLQCVETAFRALQISPR